MSSEAEAEPVHVVVDCSEPVEDPLQTLADQALDAGDTATYRRRSSELAALQQLLDSVPPLTDDATPEPLQRAASQACTRALGTLLETHRPPSSRG